MGVVVSPEDLEDTLGDEVFDFVVGARRVSIPRQLRVRVINSSLRPESERMLSMRWKRERCSR